MPTEPQPARLHGRDRGGLTAIYWDIGTEVATDVASLIADWFAAAALMLLCSCLSTLATGLAIA